MSSAGKEQKRITRREFVKGAAVGAVAVAGAGALTSCKTALAPGMPKKWDKEADVVVVGYGGAGAAVAIEASKAGAKVLVLEKMPTDGGSTAICGGIVYLGGGTAVQKAAGFTDTRDNMYNYIVAAAGDGADPELIGVYCDHSLELFDWLVGLGVKFKESYLPGKWVIPPTDDGLAYSGNEQQAYFKTIAEPVPRGHHAQAEGSSGYAWWPPIQAAVKASGAEVLHEATAEELVVNAEGRIVGVVAEVEGQKTYIKANKAVTLCAGGFGSNKEMLNLHCPEYLRCGFSIGTPGDDGSGIRMGQAVGADVRMMGQVVAYNAIYATNAALVKGVLVDDKGQRFVGEDNYGEWVGDAIVKDHPVSHLVIDDAVWGELPEAVKEALTPAAQADTIAGLASALGIESGLLENTVEFYNKFAAQGQDPEFHKDEHYVTPLETSPFYALDFTAATVGLLTTGGLRTNTKAQVLDVNGQVIPGLYSAGRNAFGVIARHYPGSGTSVGDALIFGRIAGKDAAALEPWS